LTVSDSELAVLRAGADECNSTLPWYVLQCALHPVTAQAGENDAPDRGPWLPWPKRQALAQALLSATAAMDEVRLTELSHAGSNLNQIAHAAHVTGALADDMDDALAAIQNLATRLLSIAEEMESLAKEVVRR